MAIEITDYGEPEQLLPVSGERTWAELGARDVRERLMNVGESLLYLSDLSDMDYSQRDASIVGVSESMVDAFFPVEGFSPGREGVSQEMVVTRQGTYNLGGGANVIRGASMFARRVRMITRTGQQPPLTAEIDALLEDLPSNVEVSRIIDADSQNAIKMRFLGRDDEVIGVTNFRPTELGEEESARLVGQTAEAVEEFLEEEGECTLVVSDYGRGQLTGSAAAALSAVLRTQNVTRTFLDPRPDPDSLDKFNLHGATLTPNRQEAQLLAGGMIQNGKIDSAHSAAESILGNYPDVRGVIVTLDKDGALAVDRDGKAVHSPPVIKDSEVGNPSGAGDIVIAANALLPEDRFGAQTVLDAAVWLAGISAREKNTSTLSPELVYDTQTAVNELLGGL